MKILCLQLARHGDIYQTWPTLNALKRIYPDCELHFLVREKYADATMGLNSVDVIHALPTKEIVAPLLQPRPNLESGVDKLDQFVKTLAAHNFDKIINLSFSTFSSYLVDLISESSTVISGYTRFSDGFLSIPDDASSYFYAQVGVGKHNRIHICDLFALIAGIELIEEDFRAPRGIDSSELKSPRIVIHLGASQPHKTCSTETWRTIVQDLAKKFTGQIYLIGTGQERRAFSKDFLDCSNVTNLMGQTTKISDLFSIIQGAEVMIGGDSVAVQVANLTITPTLNLSFSTVNFWETGPRAPTSRIIWYENSNQVEAPRVVAETLAMLTQQNTQWPIIVRQPGHGVLYHLRGYDLVDFSWELTRALYMNQDFPVSKHSSIYSGFKRLAELAQLAIEQIVDIEKGKPAPLATSILDDIDHLINEIRSLVPEIEPAIDWFRAEKSRIGPGPVKTILEETRKIFQRLADISQVYYIQNSLGQDSESQGLTWKS